MKHGNIKCECGKDFYFETVRDDIDCIACGKLHNVEDFPEKVEEPETLEEGEGIEA